MVGNLTLQDYGRVARHWGTMAVASERPPPRHDGSLSHSAGDIQIRENLVIGINVRLAVGRNKNWIDNP